MSSFYDDASLVVIPSGYKTSKVYAEKPTDGSGDLAFTRTGDTATRVNSAGLIERVRTNTVLQSQDQSNSAYSSVINQITSRTAVANPLTGSNNAYKILSAGGADPYIGQVVTGLSNGENTFSLWLWTDSGQNLSCDLIFYNATASEIYSKGLTITTTPTRYDFTVNFTSVGANATVRLDLCQSCGITYVYTYGWQVESGVATSYIPTTTAAVSVGPVANVPRLDYTGSTCPRLLLEPQRTNLATYSDQAAQYTLAAITIGSNVAVSPDGYTNADSIIEDGTTAAHAFYNFSLTTFTAVPYTASVYAKKGSRDWVALQLYYGTNHLAYFNLNTGTVGTVAAGATATITNVGNGWYRCTITATAAANTGGIAIYAANADNSISYTGTNGLTSAYFYGWQLELGAYPTSYIPTLAASATRGADACSKTGISSLIGQTEGTVYFEIQLPNPAAEAGRVLMQIGSAPERIYFAKDSNTQNIFQLATQSSAGYNYVNTSNLTTNTVKMAIAYKSGQNAFYLNGTLISTASATANPTSISQIVLGDPVFGNIETIVKQALVFKTRLTNAQMAELTTL